MENHKKVEGFELDLNDFCSYCPCFEAKVEKNDITRLGEASRYFTNIKCVNESKCARIAENLENNINGERKEN